MSAGDVPTARADGRRWGEAARPPWHLWVVGVLTLLITSVGVVDFVAARSVSQEYFDSLGYGAEQVAYFRTYPWLPLIFWAANIALGPVTGVLLLLRHPWAVWSAVGAFVSDVVLCAMTFGFMDRLGVLGPRLATQDLVVLLLFGLLALYCRRMSRRGVLRRRSVSPA